MHSNKKTIGICTSEKFQFPEIILYLNSDFRITGFNDAFKRIYKNPDSITNFLDIIPDSLRNPTILDLRKASNGQAHSVLRPIALFPDQVFTISYKPIYTTNDGLSSVLVTISCEDDNNPAFKPDSFISGSSIPFIIANYVYLRQDERELRIRYINTAAEKLLETPGVNLADLPIEDLFPELSGHQELNCSKNKETKSIILSSANKFSHERPVELTFNYSGNDVLIKITPQDHISLADRNLRYNVSLLENILECSPNGLLVLKPVRNEMLVIRDFICKIVNKEAARIIGKAAFELIDKSILDEIHFSQRNSVFSHFVSVVQSGVKQEFEKYCFNGWSNISAVPFDDGIVVNLTDISSEKLVYEQLMKNHELLLQSQAAAKVGSCEWDIKGNKIFWTPQQYDFWEYPFGTEITKEMILNKIHEEDREPFKRMIKDAFQDKRNLEGEFRIVKADASVVYMWIGVSITYSTNGEPIRLIGTAMDITDRINAERERRYSKQLKEAQQKLEESFEQLKRNTQEFKFVTNFMPQMVWSNHPNGQHDFFNNRWYEYTGLSEKESVQTGIISAIHPEDQEYFRQNWENSLQTAEIFDAEYRLYKHDHSFRWFLLRAMPLKDKEGIIIKWFGTCTDIHEQKLIREQFESAQEELKQKNQELRRRNTDLDNFVYTASHDLKAPINNIEGLVNGLIEECSEPSQHILLNLINQSVTRFKNTIGDLTEITRVTGKPEAPEIIELSPIAAEILESLEDYIKQTGAVITLNFEINSLIFSRKNIRSVLFNLISNAIKYRSSERTPLIKISSFMDSNQLVIEVTDNGLGMEERDIPKMFGMFKRLHNHVEGTGVGMYIVKRVIENAGGSIKVFSQINKGTTFKIYFPEQAIR